MIKSQKLDFICVGAVGIDTNVYLYSDYINFKVEMNFSQNIDNIGQAGGYSSRILKNLDCNVGFIGYIGSDYHGKFIKDSFSSWDIETLWFMDPEGTKRSINIMNKAGQRKNFYDGKGSMSANPDLEQCNKFLKNTGIVHFSIANWARYLLPICKELGLIISCDIQDIVDPDDEYRKDFIKASDVLFLSGVNFKNLTNLITSIRNLNQETLIIIGMGKKGAGISVKGTKISYYQTPKLYFPIVDTNGAGDALATGFLFAQYILKETIENSLLIGQINAQYICSQKCPKNRLMTKEQLISLFNQIKISYYSRSMNIKYFDFKT